MNVNSNAKNIFLILLILKSKVFQMVLMQKSAVALYGVFNHFPIYAKDPREIVIGKLIIPLKFSL